MPHLEETSVMFTLKGGGVFKAGGHEEAEWCRTLFYLFIYLIYLFIRTNFEVKKEIRRDSNPPPRS